MDTVQTELQEFYTDESGAFTVGRVVRESSADLVIEGIDEQGKSCGYFVMPSRMILERHKNTPYLRKIRKYMEYAEQHSYKEWFTLPPFPVPEGAPLLSGILRHAQTEGELVTVGIAGEEVPVCGFVRETGRGSVVLEAVDPESAEPLETVQCRLREIEYVEYGSIDNMLLQYACGQML